MLQNDPLYEAYIGTVSGSIPKSLRGRNTRVCLGYPGFVTQFYRYIGILR